jgi:hypothetical protein
MFLKELMMGILRVGVRSSESDGVITGMVAVDAGHLGEGGEQAQGLGTNIF